MLNLTKKITTLALMTILGVALVACGGGETTAFNPEQSLIPEISNPDKVFYSTDDYEITYQELYNSVKVNDGLNQLLAMIDTDLLADYILEVTQAEIDNKRVKLIYDTDDQELIDSIDEETKQKKIQNFIDQMFLLGYPEAEIDDYVRLVLARENYVIEYMTSEDSQDETWHIGPNQVAKYYDVTFEDDIQSIKIKFESEADASRIMRSYNLISKNGKILLYTGDKPLNEVPSYLLDETNTQELTDEEVLEYFIKMYNDVYSGFRTEIPESSTFEDLFDNEDLSVNFDEISGYNKPLAEFIFTSLGNYEEYQSEEGSTVFYTYKPERFYSGRDTAYYMILNLTAQEKFDTKDFDGTKSELIAIIGEEMYNEVEQEIIDLNFSSSSFIPRRMAELRALHNLRIHDYYLATDYKAIDTDFEIDQEGSLTLIASYDDKTISADQFFSYVMNRNAGMYLIHTAQIKALMNAHYETVYCLDTATCEYDYEKNESAKMVEHVNDYNTMKAQFEGSMYASYYTFEDYLYLAYGVKNMEEMINSYYIKQTLQPIYIFDMVKANDYEVLNSLIDMMQPYYDNYYSLKVNHLLIYVDRNEDGSPDKYEDFYEELDDEAKLTHDAKMEAFELAIRTYLEDEDNTFSSLVSEYKQALRTDETWGEFKAYGLYILTENLSTSSSLTYANSINKYEDSFVERLIELYQLYKLEENSDEVYLLDSTLLETSYGLHLIKAEKGSVFDRPSAEFEMTYNDENVPNFAIGIENDSEYISFEQLKLYAQYRFSVVAFGSVDLEEQYGFVRPSIPASVNAAFKEFASKLHDALYVVGYLNVGIVEELSLGDFVNGHAAYFDGSQEDLAAILNQISDIYNRQIFIELDLR
jgi:hypothetical protein